RARAVRSLLGTGSRRVRGGAGGDSGTGAGKIMLAGCVGPWEDRRTHDRHGRRHGGKTMKRTLSIAAVVVALLVGRPGPSCAMQPGQEFSMAIAAAAANLLYTPAKIVVAVVGMPVGAMCGWLTGGDVRAAYAVWVPAVSGSYFLTPANLDGSE